MTHAKERERKRKSACIYYYSSCYFRNKQMILDLMRYKRQTYVDINDERHIGSIDKQIIRRLIYI